MILSTIWEGLYLFHVSRGCSVKESKMQAYKKGVLFGQSIILFLKKENNLVMC